MSTAVTTTGGAESALSIWNREELDTIKSVIAPDLTDAELRLFARACRNFGLNPLMNQIHAIKRYDGATGGKKLSIQTSIHGLRLIADRTKCYAPGRRPTFDYKPDGSLLSATAYVKKFAGGQWHEVEDTAYWDEYVQTNRQGEPAALWRSKPHIMLSKCAEGLALRRAFPAETSGLYTDEEMPGAEPTRVIDRSTGEVIDAALPAANLSVPTPEPVRARMPTMSEMSGKPEPKPARNRGRLNREMVTAMEETNTTQETLLATIKDLYGVVRTGDLSDERVVAVIAWLRDQKALEYGPDGRARLVDIAPTTGPLDIESLPFDREWQDEPTEAVATATR